MKISSILLTLLITPFLMANLSMNASENNTNSKTLTPPHINNSKRVYRALTLKNGLKVILASDPSINKSSASMNVAVGSLQDPAEHQGLFHFLEHMLFLGTKKYPVVGEYSSYLQSHNGYSNAFTAEENTNYHFEIAHDALENALDRFAQFFIAPLFNATETEKEVNNVNSEHQKNIPNDLWRTNQVIRQNLKKGHPINHFSTGNIDTLKNCTREALIQEYEKFYSANEMSLAILSNKGLDELESYCVKYFSDIPNRNIKAPTYPSEILDKVEHVKFLQVKPNSDIKKLRIIYALPKLEAQPNSKISRMISSLLGHEGSGSITALLKKKGYISALSSYDDIATSYNKMILEIDLTPEGRQKYLEILETIAIYIQMLKKEPFPNYYYDELKNITLIRYQNKEEQEGTRYVVALASDIQKYGIDNALIDPYLYPDLNPQQQEEYSKILNAMNPSNCIVTLISHDVVTDQEEPYYKALFSAIDDNTLYQTLNTTNSNTNLHLPKPNQYIPKDTKIIAPRPYPLVQTAHAEIWFAQDTKFNLPKAALKFQYIMPSANDRATQEVLKALFCKCFDEILNEEIYPMNISGLAYHLVPTPLGLTLQIDGYSDQVLPLLELLGQKLKTIKIPKEIFELTKERMLRELNNSVFAPAYQQAFMLYQEILEQGATSITEKRNALEKIQFKDIQQFAEKELFKTGFIKGTIYGNLTPHRTTEAFNKFITEVGYKPLDRKKLPTIKIAQLDTTAQVTIAKKLKVNNSALLDSYHFGIEDPKRRGAALVLANISKSPYYQKMRTEEHLGYIVWSFMDQHEKNIYLCFVIQSGDFSADHLKERSDLFLQSFRAEISNLTDEALQAYKQSVINRKLEEPKTFVAANDKFFFQAFEKDADFDHVATDIEAVEQLRNEDILALYDEIFDKTKQKVFTILCYAEQHTQKIPDTSDAQTKQIKQQIKYRDQK